MWAFLKLETAAPSLDILAGANASSAPALPPPPPPPPPETADLAALFSLPPSGKGRFGHISYMMASLLCTYAVAGVVRSNVDPTLRRLLASGPPEPAAWRGGGPPLLANPGAAGAGGASDPAEPSEVGAALRAVP